MAIIQRVLMAAAMAVIASGAASADLLTEGPLTTSTPIALTLTDFSGNLAFAEFDPSLGTLDSVTFTLSSTLQTVLTVTNNSPSASTGNARTELAVNLGLTNLSNSDLDYVSANFSYSLAPGGQLTSGTLAAASVPVRGFTDSNSTQIYTSVDVLNEFTGPGTLNLGVSTTTFTDLSNSGGNTAEGQTTSASITGTVSYTYTTPSAPSVPEPASMLLMGSAMLGLGLLRKRSI
jgi:hypothetical protein